MCHSEKPACPRLALPAGLLVAVWLGSVAHAQQIPTFPGPAANQRPPSAAPGQSPAAPLSRGYTAAMNPAAISADSAGPRRMGVLEYRQQPPASEGHIVVVGGVRQNLVIRTQRSEVSLDALIDRAGGLAPDATGAIQIFRNGQPRMNLLYVPGSGTNVLPGDTILVAARPLAKPAAPDAPPPPEPIVSIVCHNILPRPIIVRLPASVATIESLARGFGQDLAALPPALPPRGVVLPAAQPTVSRDMLLPTGTSLYFDPQHLNRITLDTLLATRLRLDDAVDLEKKTTAATESPSLSSPPAALPFNASVPGPAPISSATPLPVPVVPAPLELPQTDPLLRPVAPVPTVSAAPGFQPRPIVPPGEPGRVDAAQQRVEIVRDVSAVAASLERVVSEKRETTSLVPPTELPAAREAIAPAAGASVNRDAITRGLMAGAVIGVLAGLYAWLRTRWTAEEPRRPSASAVDLPIVEESPVVRPQPLHGRVVADRRLAFDPPHETLTGPHFDAARPKARPPLVRTAAGTKVEPAKTNSAARTSAAVPAPAPPAAKPPATGGLLDRILIAMQRERSR